MHLQLYYHELEIPFPLLINMTESTTDVLIIGAGPAGLMLANWLCKTGVSTRIIDRRPSKITVGHADGFHCRTIEVFQSFGIAHKIIEECNEVTEVSFYNPDANGNLVRTDRIPDTEPGTSRFRHAVLTQARVECFLLDNMKANNGLLVERAVEPQSLSIDSTSVDSPDAYPVTIVVKHLPRETGSDDEAAKAGGPESGLYRSNLFADEVLPQPEEQGGYNETIRAKYVVGCDGARSWTRKQIGYELHGETSSAFWGVMDARVVTDFPDIRLKVAIHSASNGSILIIPRERDLVRFYIQMGTIEPGQQIDRRTLTHETIVAKAKSIMTPFTLECPEIEWWSVYVIGQRLCKQVSLHDRVFIAGDAFHTHSPKAGQGMNVSMMDSYNLGWKLSAVLKGTANRCILDTYRSERVAVAQQLIDFDRKLGGLFSGKPATAQQAGITVEEFKDLWLKLGKWTSGTAVQYTPSMIVAAATEETNQLASNILIGSHFESQIVVCIADAHPVHLANCLISDGRWRLVIFAGMLTRQDQRARYEKLCAELSAPKSPVKMYQVGRDVDSFIEILTVIASERRAFEITEYPDIARPTYAPYGYRKYHTIFADEVSHHEGGGEAYRGYGIDPDGPGAVVLIRPDQHVADVLPFDTCVSRLAAFFAPFTRQTIYDKVAR